MLELFGALARDKRGDPRSPGFLLSFRALRGSSTPTADSLHRAGRTDWGGSTESSDIQGKREELRSSNPVGADRCMQRTLHASVLDSTYIRIIGNPPNSNILRCSVAIFAEDL